MIEPIFEGTRARCKQHPSTLLMPDEGECDVCKKISRDLSLKPPFDVICTRSWGGAKKGGTYKVWWVVRDASREHSNITRGYVFKDDKGNLVDHIFDLTDFVPVQFANEIKKEEEKEEEKEKEAIEEIWGWG